jgi:hypothetical protein
LQQIYDYFVFNLIFSPYKKANYKTFAQHNNFNMFTKMWSLQMVPMMLFAWGQLPECGREVREGVGLADDVMENPHMWSYT